MAELYYPSTLTETSAFPANVHFTFYERFSTGNSEMRDQIHLYMPEQFGQPNTLTWDSSFRGGQAVLASAGAAVGDTGSRIANSIADRSSAAGKFLMGKISDLWQAGGAAKDLFELKQGMYFNPYLSQIFRAVDFRNFQYTFRFVPFTREDCGLIKQIITIFRKWSLPSGPSGGANSFYLNYPGEIDVQYQFYGKENMYIHRFKRSVITSIDIDYTGAGMWTMMRNGFPTETVMNIAFSEIQIIVREDVEKHNY